jgi:hypothetical protein
MALGEDDRGLSTGANNSPLGDEGWEPVKVERPHIEGWGHRQFGFRI